MQQILPKKNVPWHEQSLYLFFKHKFKKHVPQGNKPYHLIDDEEDIGLRALQWKAIVMTSLTGVMGVCLLYLPGIVFPDSYLSQTKHLLEIYQMELPLQPYFLGYGVLLAFLEIVVLTFIHLWVVRKIAQICDFPHRQDPRRDAHIRVLFEVSLEKEDKSLLRFNLNPLAGLSYWKTLAYNLLNVLKATLSNIFIKLILSRILGRFVLRALIDLVGIPVFAFWNGMATWRVIREAKIRIMAPPLVQDLCKILAKDYQGNEAFEAHLYDMLQWIAVTKRNFHHNHLLLASQLHDTFQFAYQDKKAKSFEEILPILQRLPEEVREGLLKVFLFGLLIDGSISAAEVRFLKQLDTKLHINKALLAKLRLWAKEFVNGRGLASFLTKKIIVA